MTPQPNLNRIVDALRPVAGVVGVVLGGSRARGVNAPDADYDIGVYYAGGDSLDIAGLAAAAAELDDERRDNLIAPPGAWGKWVDGGGWLTVDGAPVDLILRDIRRVEQAVADCRAGVVDAHYQTGHPHAYLNVMYAGELAIANILYEADGSLSELKNRTAPYPEKLRGAIIGMFGFEAGFSLMLAKVGAGRNDDYYAAAHIVRAVSCLNQVLFARNGEYCINEKKAVAMADAFPLSPPGYAKRVSETIAKTGTDSAAACRLLEALVADVRELCEA